MMIENTCIVANEHKIKTTLRICHAYGADGIIPPKYQCLASQGLQCYGMYVLCIESLELRGKSLSVAIAMPNKDIKYCIISAYSRTYI